MKNFWQCVRTMGKCDQQVQQDWIARKLQTLPQGSRVLDAGAGQLQNRVHCDHLEYVSQDFMQYAPETDDAATAADNSLQMSDWEYGSIDIACDITDIPEADGSFDAILCSEVLEHLPEPLEAIREFARLLKPGGQLFITAPFMSLDHFSPYYFHTGFSTNWYEYACTKHGLTLHAADASQTFFETVAMEVRRAPRIARKYTGKKPGILFKVDCTSLC